MEKQNATSPLLMTNTMQNMSAYGKTLKGAPRYDSSPDGVTAALCTNIVFLYFEIFCNVVILLFSKNRVMHEK